MVSTDNWIWRRAAVNRDRVGVLVRCAIMKYKPLVSVIIPSYDSARFVVAAVQSALAQTYSPVEIIVVDDGSTDDTRERLLSCVGPVRYVYQSNGGPSKARNRGLQEARGELIAFLDADDQWMPEKLIKQWGCLRANPDAGLIHTDTYQLYEPTGQQVYVDHGKKRFSGRCYTELFWGNRITTSTVLVPRQCLDQVGPFDERIRGAEDMDLWLRIARHHSLDYVNEPLVLYRNHALNSSRNQRMMLEVEYYVLAKALKADPSLTATLGQHRVRERMFDLAFEAGYGNVDADDLPRARRYFREALSYDPLSLKAWTFWTSTFLPLGIRKGLRHLKQWAASLA